MKVALASEMQEIERHTQQEYLIPASFLMERAALAVLEELKRRSGCLTGQKIYVFCGKGNNGGDGLALARFLIEKMAEVTIVLLALAEEYQGLALENFNRAVRYGVRNIYWQDFNHLEIQSADWIVDALLGTGSIGAPRKEYAKAIGLINSSRKRVIAMDLPSGVDSDTGKVVESAVNADCTVTFGTLKPGLIFYPGATYAGEIIVAQIGFPEKLLTQAKLKINWSLAREIKNFLPSRPVNAHKGITGHLLIVGGSSGMTGAPMMASLSALRTGAGIVTLAHQTGLELAQKPLEIITKDWTEIPWGNHNYRAVVIGPGLGTEVNAKEIFEKVCDHCFNLPVVIDADGLNLLATHPELWGKLPNKTVLTPHLGEFSRLTGRTVVELEAKRLEAARTYASEWGVTLVLKGARTIIATAEGEIFINPTGNKGMATAGMGDLLAGMIGSLLVQGVELAKAVVTAVYLHGFAGDLVSVKLGTIGIMATDLLSVIPVAINKLMTEEDMKNE